MGENRQIRQVRAAIHGVGKYRVHASLFDIAETLMKRWPTEELSAAHWQARQLCSDCYDGKCTPEDARDAFILALDEAGISIMLEDREPRYPVVPEKPKKRRAPMGGETSRES